MTDDLVVLWRDSVATHGLCYEIVQIAEGDFELRVLCDGRPFLSEDGPDFDALLERARQLRADLKPAAIAAATPISASSPAGAPRRLRRAPSPRPRPTRSHRR